MTETVHWSTLREAGTYRGILFMLWLHRHLGRRVFNLALYPVMTYFFIAVPVARRASLEYLQRHQQSFPHCWDRPPGYRDVFRHMYAFGQSILDKLLAWSAPIDEGEFEIADEALLASFMQKDSGQLIIGSHFGNLEYCRGFVQRYKNKVINALVYDQHSANFVNAMQSLSEDSRVHIYQVDQLDIPTILTLKAKIEAGEWLFIAGDRIPLSGEQRTVNVRFLGHDAPLPIGPYMLAKMLECEVQLMFSYRTRDAIRFELVPFADKITVPRGQRDHALQSLAQRFADALEKQCEQAPFQWFNFYPYWQAPSESTEEQTSRG